MGVQRYLLMGTLFFALLSVGNPAAAVDEIFASSSLPVGIYVFHSPLTSRPCHLFVLETGSMGQAAYLTEIPRNDDDFVTYVPFWRGRCNTAEQSFEATGSNLRDVNIIRMRFSEGDLLSGSILSTNPSLLCAPNGGRMGEEVHFQAERNPQEKLLIDLANARSMFGRADAIVAEGSYRGSLGQGSDATPVTLTIRSHPRDGALVWIATMKVGQLTTIPLISAPSNRGLIRFMRSSGPIPGEVSGLTGAAIACGPGQCPDRRVQNGVEFRGLFFVPRNGRLTPIRLQKIN